MKTLSLLFGIFLFSSLTLGLKIISLNVHPSELLISDFLGSDIVASIRTDTPFDHVSLTFTEATLEASWTMDFRPIQPTNMLTFIKRILSSDLLPGSYRLSQVLVCMNTTCIRVNQSEVASLGFTGQLVVSLQDAILPEIVSVQIPFQEIVLAGNNMEAIILLRVKDNFGILGARIKATYLNYTFSASLVPENLSLLDVVFPFRLVIPNNAVAGVYQLEIMVQDNALNVVNYNSTILRQKLLPYSITLVDPYKSMESLACERDYDCAIVTERIEYVSCVSHTCQCVKTPGLNITGAALVKDKCRRM